VVLHISSAPPKDDHVGTSTLVVFPWVSTSTDPPLRPGEGRGHPSAPEGCLYSDRWPHQRVSPSRLVGERGAMGFGVARQCSRNRCLARWTVWIPDHGRGGRARRANSKKDLITARSEVFVPYTAPSADVTPA
jgi:hypothetical protein